MPRPAIDFNTYERIYVILRTLTGLQFEAVESQREFKGRLKVIAKNSYYIFCFVNIVICYVFTCKRMWEKSKGDVKLVFYLVATAMSTGVTIVRIFYIFLIKSDIGRIAQLLTKSYSKEEADYYDLNGDIRSFKRIMRIFFSTLGMTIIFFFLDPLLTLILTGERTFGNLTPFDESATSPRIYPFALLWVFWEFCSLVCCVTGLEIVVNCAVMITVCEFKVLRKDFADLRNKLRARDAVRMLIRRHNDLFTTAERLEAAYSFPLFLSFYSTAALICFTAFQASTSNDPAELLGMGYFCLSSLFQIFTQSYFGDLLKSASGDVLYGIYESGWEEMHDMPVRRALAFIIKRARTPAKLTVMKIADVSLYQFANVVSFSYSFFTLCRRVYFGKN